MLVECCNSCDIAIAIFGGGIAGAALLFAAGAVLYLIRDSPRTLFRSRSRDVVPKNPREFYNDRPSKFYHKRHQKFHYRGPRKRIRSKSDHEIIDYNKSVSLKFQPFLNISALFFILASLFIIVYWNHCDQIGWFYLAFSLISIGIIIFSFILLISTLKLVIRELIKVKSIQKLSRRLKGIP